MSHFLSFLNDDPLTMEDDELDAYLADSGIDFEKFDARLSSDIDTALKKSRLVEAKQARKGFLATARKVIELGAMTIDQKRAEIEQRLGLLGSNAAAVFNRNYEGAENEEDIDGLLVALRALDERAE